MIKQTVHLGLSACRILEWIDRNSPSG
jgi:hypothetical protein